MIQESFNAISTGARGKFGNQVVMYVRYGRLIIAKAPRKRPGRGTDGQERTKAQFKEGAAWSAKVRKSAALHAVYKAGLYDALNVHNLAIADFLQAPVIHAVEVGDQGIMVMATDNFKVAGVTVKIYNGKGQLVEGGKAVQEKDGTWLYVPCKEQLDGCRILVSARDLPGNEAVKELVIEGESVVYPPATGIKTAEKAVAGHHAYDATDFFDFHMLNLRL
ncbi:hypothetical protein MKQ68_11200 [Chitinophaga horti]|uniref:Uncharacterized protein n=1 Tax=Chitinophaga horti TaxID=2920382 RepID=A0ABY6JBH7_9BACT|nr:hypothetical protein [Chitinophaga horti]UYQ95669.1 hypothetical protein MKQ68_11200 [Chitinophaga horti]